MTYLLKRFRSVFTRNQRHQTTYTEKKFDGKSTNGNLNNNNIWRNNQSHSSLSMIDSERMHRLRALCENELFEDLQTLKLVI